MTTTIPSPIQSVVQQIIMHYKPQKVVLFGSRAEGSAKADSDYDLFIVKDTSGTISQRQYDVWKTLSNWEVPCDFVVYTPEEVQKARQQGSWFLNHIEKYGKVLYAN